MFGLSPIDLAIISCFLGVVGFGLYQSRLGYRFNFEKKLNLPSWARNAQSEITDTLQQLDGLPSGIDHRNEIFRLVEKLQSEGNNYCSELAFTPMPFYRKDQEKCDAFLAKQRKAFNAWDNTAGNLELSGADLARKARLIFDQIYDEYPIPA